MNQAVGVLIVDEPRELETTFRAVLEHEPRLQTVSEADLTRGQGAPARSVALVFVGSEPGAAILSRIAMLKGRQPGLTVLVAFESLRADLLGRLVQAGADAFVARSATPRDVCHAILALAASPVTPPSASEEAAGEGASVIDGLTPREAEILRFLSAGFSNKEVARRLNLSVRTVETHRLNLRRKTQTGRLKDLVSLARQLGLAPVVDAETIRQESSLRVRVPRVSEKEQLARL
ncbi:response regulator transcription factor [Methylobacterium sp. J-068]|uniref:response regulator transcription factor n=1 Tax=Methylobacterium sp. J-068 TaxID=2836649 RepID=UPI001FB9D7F5|nr:response regulator transcription factor [Methylobacterium sp. J-068]MCJ2034073.1 response regulator transcription factor [Methylobacterium sp. J-068]